MRGGSVAEKSADVLDRVEREKVGYLAELEEYLRIPSISTDPEYKAEVDRCSQWLLERMERAGLKAQRVDWVEEWHPPPFEPRREGDNLVARGATDDKGQWFTHLLAVEATLAARGSLPVNAFASS